MAEQAPTLWQVFKSVIASFFGVQSEENWRRDFSNGKPGQFIIIGLLLTFVFILVVYLIVQVILHFALQ